MIAARIVPLVGAAALAILAVVSAAQAQDKLEARYTVTLAGVPIGRGALVLDIGNDRYLAAVSGATAGLLRLISSGEGTGATRGRIVNGALTSATFAARIDGGQSPNEVRIGLNGGTVKELSVAPPLKPDPARVPVTAAHKRGVVDPITAGLVRVAPRSDPLHPGSCQRSLPVFDGRLRFNLHLAYKRTETVAADKGYAGPALVCAIYFEPVAGHIPSRAAIRHLSQVRDAEVWLAPVGVSVLVPFRFTFPTPLGLGVLQARQFVTAAQPPQPTRTRVGNP